MAAELTDDIRVPLDSLHADALYLASRVAQGTMSAVRLSQVIRERIDAAKAALATQQATQGAEPVGGAERWMAIVREKADDARKNAQGLRQFEGMEAEARARELAAQYLLETAHVMVLDERHAEALANIVDQSERLARLRAAITAPPPTVEVEKKAARYDWLRAHWFDFGVMMNVRTKLGSALSAINRAADVETLDAVIDAALQFDQVQPTKDT